MKKTHFFKKIFDFIVKHSLAFQIVLSILLGVGASTLYSSLNSPLGNTTAYIVFLLILILVALVIVVYYIQIKRLISENQNIMLNYSSNINKNIRDVSEKTKNYIDDVLTGGLLIQSQAIEFRFSEEILKSGTCNIFHTIHLYNPHQSKIYPHYLFRVSSSDELQANYRNYIAYHDTISEDTKYMISDNERRLSIERPYNEDSSDNRIKWTYSMNIPVNIAPESALKCIICENDCPCFKSFKKEEPSVEMEKISSTVSYPTDILSFSLQLDDVKLSNYKFVEKFVEYDSKHLESYEVRDHSNVLDIEYIHAIANRGYRPSLSNNGRKLEWSIPNPKIGCTYRLFFTLERSE